MRWKNEKSSNYSNNSTIHSFLRAEVVTHTRDITSCHSSDILTEWWTKITTAPEHTLGMRTAAAQEGSEHTDHGHSACDTTHQAFHVLFIPFQQVRSHDLSRTADVWPCRTPG